MADYAAPSGPPPPKAPDVPAGWAARWNEQYKEWFYVNVYTKKSQWEKPTAPVFPTDDAPPADAPPGYEPGHNAPLTADTKKNPYEEVPATHGAGSSSADEDAKLAAKLQAEEDAKARGGPQPPAGYGAADSYAQGAQSGGSQAFPEDLPPRDRGKDRGFLGKLFGKGKNSSNSGQYNSYGQQGGYPQQQYGGGYSQAPPPQQYGYPQGPPPQQYGGYGQPPMGYGGGYGGGYGPPQQQGYGGGYGGGGGGMMGGGRRPGGGMGGMGMGLAGGAALGLGAGVLGGALIEHEINENQQEAYQQGYQDGDHDNDNDYGGGGGDYDGGGGDFDGGGDW